MVLGQEAAMDNNPIANHQGLMVKVYNRSITSIKRMYIGNMMVKDGICLYMMVHSGTLRIVDNR